MGRVETAAVGLPRSRAGVNWKSQSGHHRSVAPGADRSVERRLRSDYCRSRLEAARRQVGRNGRSALVDRTAAVCSTAAIQRASGLNGGFHARGAADPDPEQAVWPTVR